MYVLMKNVAFDRHELRIQLAKLLPVRRLIMFSLCYDDLAKQEGEGYNPLSGDISKFGDDHVVRPA